jgi:hypothetical protein
MRSRDAALGMVLRRFKAVGWDHRFQPGRDRKRFMQHHEIYGTNGAVPTMMANSPD